MKVLFIVPYPTEGPSNRYRVEQYLSYLEKNGIGCSLRPFISRDFFRILYKKGMRLKKIIYFLSASLKRFYDLIDSANYDLVFIHIETFPFGPAIFEEIFSKLNKPIIYDFEDAIYLSDFKKTNRFTGFLRYPHKFYRIIKLSSHVIVCNKYMKELVYPYNPKVTIIPTSIDTEKFKLKKVCLNTKIPVIGWIGSHTTFIYLKQIFPVFEKLSKRHKFILKIVGAGANNMHIPGVQIINEEWSLEKEVDNFHSLDIGVYPLADNEESRAKTPFKTIQYMAVGLPTVALGIGGNREIIQDGVNGFLVSNENQWVEKLSLMIGDASLRQKIGIAGRKTVEERYSLGVNSPRFFQVINEVFEEHRRTL